MINDGMQFEDALKLAQELGYAERNPAADIEGHDACRKICILASLAFGKHVYPQYVHTEGITAITLEDVKYAEKWGGVIKLIGQVKLLENKKLDIFVAPMFVPNKSQLSDIDDVFNGIMVRGDCTGDVVFYGRGAGKLPTASAVVADIVDCCKHLKARKRIFWTDGGEDLVIPYDESVTAMYLRLKSKDGHCAYDMAKEVFDGNVEPLVLEEAQESEIAVITNPMPYGMIKNKISDLEAKGVCVLSALRIGDL